jgi:hypothetical protein
LSSGLLRVLSESSAQLASGNHAPFVEIRAVILWASFLYAAEDMGEPRTGSRSLPAI